MCKERPTFLFFISCPLFTPFWQCCKSKSVGKVQTAQYLFNFIIIYHHKPFNYYVLNRLRSLDFDTAVSDLKKKSNLQGLCTWSRYSKISVKLNYYLKCCSASVLVLQRWIHNNLSWSRNIVIDKRIIN